VDGGGAWFAELSVGADEPAAAPAAAAPAAGATPAALGAEGVVDWTCVVGDCCCGPGLGPPPCSRMYFSRT